jgi:hypothetical protein
MKTKYNIQIISAIFLAKLIFFGFVLTGCYNKGADVKDSYLFKIGSRTVSVFEFNKALEIAEIAYPHNVTQDSETYNTIRRQLLNQMIEEVIFLTEAEKLNIVVSDDDFKKMVEDIKSDYPDDEFERTILENAVSYDTWEQRMKIRLIMEKLVKTQVEDQIIITKEDVLKYYRENNPDRTLTSESRDQQDSINEMIVKRLKRQKAQEAYIPWIKDLKDRYRDKIKINEKKWKEIMESNGV